MRKLWMKNSKYSFNNHIMIGKILSHQWISVLWTAVNDFFTIFTLKYVIGGMCEEIINISDDKHKFNKCLKIAIYYHQNNIIDWFLLNYGKDECDHVLLPMSQISQLWNIFIITSQ